MSRVGLLKDAEDQPLLEWCAEKLESPHSRNKKPNKGSIRLGSVGQRKVYRITLDGFVRTVRVQTSSQNGPYISVDTKGGTSETKRVRETTSWPTSDCLTFHPIPGIYLRVRSTGIYY